MTEGKVNASQVQIKRTAKRFAEKTMFFMAMSRQLYGLLFVFEKVCCFPFFRRIQYAYLHLN